MPAYEADLAKFAELDAQVVGISQDTYFCHRAWQAKEIGWMHYPLASDYYPHGATVRAYGILREGPPLPGISERAVFVVDKEGRIVFSQIYELSEQPPNAHVLEVLRGLMKTEQAAAR
jgi:peroxiredoxin